MRKKDCRRRLIVNENEARWTNENKRFDFNTYLTLEELEIFVICCSSTFLKQTNVFFLLLAFEWINLVRPLFNFAFSLSLFLSCSNKHVFVQKYRANRTTPFVYYRWPSRARNERTKWMHVCSLELNSIWTKRTDVRDSFIYQSWSIAEASLISIESTTVNISNGKKSSHFIALSLCDILVSIDCNWPPAILQWKWHAVQLSLSSSPCNTSKYYCGFL